MPTPAARFNGGPADHVTARPHKQPVRVAAAHWPDWVARPHYRAHLLPPGGVQSRAAEVTARTWG